MQKENDITKSNGNWAEVTSDVIDYLQESRDYFTRSAFRPPSSKQTICDLLQLPYLIGLPEGLPESARFALLVQVKLIHLFSNGSTFGVCSSKNIVDWQYQTSRSNEKFARGPRASDSND